MSPRVDLGLAASAPAEALQLDSSVPRPGVVSPMPEPPQGPRAVTGGPSQSAVLFGCLELPLEGWVFPSLIPCT